MKRIDEVMAAVRANPVRYAAWMLVLAALCVAGYHVGRGLGAELYIFTH